MRLVNLELSGFRGFAKRESFDFDADAIVVVGANGSGKTSLFDGILWAISGRVPRLGEEQDVILSKFSETGEALAVVRLRLGDRTSECLVTRVFDGENTRLSVEMDGSAMKGPAAEGKLIELLWQDAASAPDSRVALASAVTRSVYLQQDLIREFIEASSNQDRFTAVSELIGAGRVADLQVRLEHAKAAWTKTTNTRQKELELLQDQRAVLEMRLTEILNRRSQSKGDRIESAWNAWWRRIDRLGLQLSGRPLASRDAPTALDAAVKNLDGLRRSAERRVFMLTALKGEVGALVGQTQVDLQPLRDKADSLRGEVKEAQKRVHVEQERAAEARRIQAAAKEEREQLRALATLALKHLADHCPVCAQKYDIEATRHRLETIAREGSTTTEGADEQELLPRLLAVRATKEKELAAAELALRTADQAAQERLRLEQSITRRIAELALEIPNGTDRAMAVQNAIKAANEQIDGFAQQQRSGEALALQITQAADQARADELRKEIEALEAKSKEKDRVVKERQATGDLGQKIIEALREATLSVVAKRLEELAPLLQTIYSRIDPHPAFRIVDFMSEIVRGRGRLYTVIQDPVSDIQSDAPGTVLSSSQMNALAVSVFLSLNLGVARPPLDLAILDDPLQSLDDINLLGLIDLLRRTKDRRQLCVSTHDARFGNLLARKLRPGNEQQRTVVIELKGWSRAGPIIETRNVKSDPAPLRLITSRSG